MYIYTYICIYIFPYIYIYMYVCIHVEREHIRKPLAKKTPDPFNAACGEVDSPIWTWEMMTTSRICSATVTDDSSDF